MAKIYEALEQAVEEGRWEQHKQLFVLRQKKLVDPLRIVDGTVQEKMVNLYRSLQMLLPQQHGGIVHILAPYKSTATTALTREFAKTVALRLDKKVLLLDATPDATQLAHFNMVPECNWKQAYRDHKPVREAIYQIGSTQLFVSQISKSHTASAITEIIESPLTKQYFNELRHLFDLILIDSAPGIDSVDSVALACKTDGIIIALESEKTRWQVAHKLTQLLRQQGGNVLGTILNQHHHYIPQFLYDRL